MIREKIANNIFQGFYGSYPFPKDWGRESKQCLKVADQILSLITTEIEKGLLSDEELDDCYFNPPTTIGNEFIGHRGVNRHIAQAQLDKILNLLKEKA